MGISIQGAALRAPEQGGSPSLLSYVFNRVKGMIKPCINSLLPDFYSKNASPSYTKIQVSAAILLIGSIVVAILYFRKSNRDPLPPEPPLSSDRSSVASSLSVVIRREIPCAPLQGPIKNDMSLSDFCFRIIEKGIPKNYTIRTIMVPKIRTRC